jgi:hypothetical protein
MISCNRQGNVLRLFSIVRIVARIRIEQMQARNADVAFLDEKRGSFVDVESLSHAEECDHVPFSNGPLPLSEKKKGH